MSGGPTLVADPRLRDWQHWEGRERTRGRAEWKALIGSEVTASEGVSLGLGRVAPGEELALHRHPEAEIYLVLAGTATIELDGEEHQVEAGGAVYIPGDAPHACRNRSAEELRFAYVFAADSTEDVAYEFAAEGERRD